MYKLYPIPTQLKVKDGFLPPVSGFSLHLDSSIATACAQAGFVPDDALSRLCDTASGSLCDFRVIQKDMHAEAYELTIEHTGISVSTAGAAGLFYAVQSLRQLADQCGGFFPCLEIFDSPALDIRGVLLDIGRNKIPSLKTMFDLLDKFSSMRINHVEFYMEGYCYNYSNYAYLFSDDTPVTAEEFKALDDYAKRHFIDLVPNQNVLGHMDKWLAKPQMNHLAECEDGFIYENLFWRPPMTLDVRDERSYGFITGLLDDLLQSFSSPLINVNMDEPFELGKGKNKQFSEKNGTSKLYLDYVRKINDYCRSKGKRMMMWGDQVVEDSGSIASLPKDVILLDWIYEGDANFETHAKCLQSTGLDYCLCPGTSSWCSIAGRSDNMKKNIRNAVDCTCRYGGKGIITTDWGDLGHWQYISSSYPAFTLSGLYSWSGCDADESSAAWFLNHYIYGDKTEQAYNIAYDLGNYYHYEHAPLCNTTLSFAVMASKYAFDSLEEFDSKIQRMMILSANIARTNHIAIADKDIHLDYNGLLGYLDEIGNRIQALKLDCAEGDLMIAEMQNSIRMIRHGARLYYALTEHRHDAAALKTDLQDLFQQLDSLMQIHYRLWMARNRTGGFSESISHMQHLLKFYQKQIKQL